MQYASGRRHACTPAPPPPHAPMRQRARPTPKAAPVLRSCTATHNMLKVATNLLRWSGDAKYADWTERALLNSVLGTQRGTEHGAMLYTLPLGQGVSKRDKQAWRTSERGGWSTAFHDWWCCSGTGLEGFARLQEAVFFHGGAEAGPTNTLTVMQFISSTARWRAAP